MELAKVFGTTKDKVGELVTAGKVGAKEFNQAIMAMSSEGGKFAGLMEAQSKTITGQISNIEDAIDVMFNDLGKQSEGIINGTLDVVSSLVENYQKVGEVIGGLVATYGTYKAAVITVTALQGLQAAGVGALTAAETAHYGWLVLCEKAQKLLNATMLANPYVLAATAVAALGAAIYAAASEASEMEEAQRRLDDQTKENEASVLNEMRNLDSLNRQLQECEKGTEQYRKVKQSIIDQYGQYYSGLDAEIEKVGNLSGVYDKLTEAIRRSIGARNLKSFYDKEMENYDKTVSEKLNKAYDVLQKAGRVSA